MIKAGLSRLKQWQGLRSQAWLARRIPAAKSLQLSRKQLFILPTSFGWWFLLTLLVMLVMGSNYQNNLVLALALWMLVLWLMCLVLCHQNLSGLVVNLVHGPEGQLGQPLRLLLSMKKSRGKPVQALQAKIKQWPLQQASQVLDGQLALDLEVKQRGYQRLPRVTLYSVFPFGLFRCWTVADFCCDLIAYPQPLAGHACPAKAQTEQHDIEHSHSDSLQQHEFSGLKAYRSGERKSLLAWKQFAAGRGLQIKTFTGNPAQGLHLSDSLSAGLDYEQRLAVLAFWVRQLAKLQHSFSLRVNGEQLPMGQGERHQQQALRMLAGAPKRL